jgi:hypothetical protein
MLKQIGRAVTVALLAGVAVTGATGIAGAEDYYPGGGTVAPMGNDYWPSTGGVAPMGDDFWPSGGGVAPMGNEPWPSSGGFAAAGWIPDYPLNENNGATTPPYPSAG